MRQVTRIKWVKSIWLAYLWFPSGTPKSSNVRLEFIESVNPQMLLKLQMDGRRSNSIAGNFPESYLSRLETGNPVSIGWSNGSCGCGPRTCGPGRGQYR